MMIPILIAISGFMAALAQILLKASASKTHGNLVKEYLNPYVLISYTLYFLVLALNIFLFTKMDYRFGVLSNSLAIVFVLILSKVILSEAVGLRKVIGMTMIVAGVMCFYLL